jgi:MoxR-like ATPase
VNSPEPEAELAQDVARLSEVTDRVNEYFVGHPDVVEKLLASVLAGGHVLFEDYPGLGKTLLVKTLSQTIEADFNRVQFTPDVLPSDILGTRIWDPDERSFTFEKGPVFTNILLADEINRAPPKTQSALLEAMEEGQTTVDGDRFALPQPFFVLATQNPIEQEGTYPLPEAQMDRFLLRMQTGYPKTEDDEREILRRRIEWREDDPTDRIEPVISRESFVRLQRAAESVFVHEELLGYMSKIVRALRDWDGVEVGPSPRGALALLKASRAMALIRGRTFATPDDVKSVAVEALSHRTILEVEEVLEGAEAEQPVRRVVDEIPAPTPKQEPSGS